MTLMREEIFFVVLFVFNFLAAAVYLLWGICMVTVRNRKQKEREGLYDNRRSYLMRFLVMVFSPAVGLLFFLISFLLCRTVFRFQVDLEDVIFNKNRVRTQIKADEDRERDLIPAEEAVIVNDKRSMRMTMMNIIKGDLYGSLSSLALALDAGDSETAHYAASALSDILNEFRRNVYRMNLKIQEEEAEETEGEEHLLDSMGGVLRQAVFTKPEQKRFVHILEQTAEALYTKDAGKFTVERYEEVCLCLLETGEFEACEKWCLRLAEQYPEALASYTCRLKLYFTAKNREAFFRTLSGLKASDVSIDSETLEMIRIFS